MPRIRGNAGHLDERDGAQREKGNSRDTHGWSGFWQGYCVAAPGLRQARSLWGWRYR